MLTSRSIVLAASLGLTGWLFVGCSSSPISRIDANRALYESWPLDVQQAVLDGRVIENMTPEQVEMAVGKPAEKTARNTRNGTEEVWVYKVGGGVPNVPVTIGGSIGGVGVVQQRGMGSPAEFHEVVFVNGRVVRSTLP